MTKQHRATEAEWQVVFESAKKGYIYCSATAELADRLAALERTVDVLAAQSIENTFEQLRVRVNEIQYGPLPQPPAYRGFNINSEVYVRLTDLGHAIVRDEGTVYQSDKAEDAEGYSKWILWELMYVFGRHLYNGCKLPFDTTIRLTNERI
jgi:hypothetical protein